MQKYVVAFIVLLSFAFSAIAQEKLPPANEAVFKYVSMVVGQKIKRGECWELASEALIYAHANWQRPTDFGRLIDHEKESILPGDIIQFENVIFEFKTLNVIKRENKQQHTAIVYKVKGRYDLIIAEQNVNRIRKVMLNPLNLSTMIQGTIKIYRPQL